MKRIVLVSCVSVKKDESCQAWDLYDSAWFKKAKVYAKSLNPDKIYILSAKYGLLNPDEIIAPYNETLNNMTAMERKNWAEKVKQQMKNEGIKLTDKIIFLAGQRYRENLEEGFKKSEVPMRGLRIGQQMKFMGNI